MTKSILLKNTDSNSSVLKNDLSFVILTILFLIGFVVSAFSIYVCENNNFYELDSYIDSYISFLKSSDYFNVLKQYLIFFFILVFINFIFGLCLIGNAISFVLSFLYSFGFGSITAYFYKVYGYEGMSFFFVCILPGLFLFSINYILSLKHSISFSKSLFKFCFKNEKISINFKNYLYKYLIHYLLCVFCATVFSFFSSCFVEKFNL